MTSPASLIAIGLALLLVMLRLDAERSGRPSTTRRPATASGRASGAGWPGTASGFALVVAILFIHPVAADGPLPRLRRPARGGPRRARRTALLGDRASRSPSRPTATTGSASRTPGRTRARCSTRPRPRSSTRSPSAARCFGLLLVDRRRPDGWRTSSRPSSTRWRRGSGRPAATATCWSWRSGSGLVGGWLTVADRRDRRGVPRPRHHPLRGLPVHRPRRPDQAARPRGRGDREAPPRRPRAGASSGRGSRSSRDR